MHHISKFFGKGGASWEFLLLNTTRVAENIYLVMLVPRCFCCCLRILKPGGLELLKSGLLGRRLIPSSWSSCAEGNFNFGTSWWIIRSRNLKRNFFFFFFLSPSPFRRSVLNCWTLGCWSVVLSTRPRSSCWENNFGTSWWVMRSKNINRKSPSPCQV